MGSWFSPLRVFISGSVFSLFAYLLLGAAIDAPVAALAANTSAIASNYWGWGWLMTAGVVRWLVTIGLFLGTCIMAGIAFLKSKQPM